MDGIRAIAIELKDTTTPDLIEAPGLPDAFPRTGAVPRLENERIAVWEYQWLPGRVVPLHFIAFDSIVVPVESGSVRLLTESGETHTVELTFGEPMWVARGDSVREEVLQGTPRAIIVELK